MKPNVIIVILVIVALGILAYINPENYKSTSIFETPQHCCKIVVERHLDSNGEFVNDVFYSNYRSEEENRPVQDEYWNVPDDELESVVNYYQEYCYKNHKK